jgi:hypothetical protein
MPLPEFNQATMGQRKPEYLAWTALCVAMGVQSYVELGSGSAHFIRQAGVPQVISVDIAHSEELFHNPYREDGVRYSKGDSHHPSTLHAVLDMLGGPPDAVFIDADHDYAPVKADFELWWPSARLLVGFHDIQIPSVAQFWKEISLGISSVKLIGCDRASAVSWQGEGSPADAVLSAGGIGVLFR